MNGKGSRPRPVHWPTYAANWDLIFNNANRPVGPARKRPGTATAKARGKTTPAPTPARIGRRRLLPPATPVPRGKAG